MSFYWRPKIDKWVENINVNNTPSFPVSYQYAPGEGEEKHKVFVTGHGKLTIEELKTKIKDIVNELASLSNSDDIESIDKIKHTLYSSSDLSNLLDKYIDAVRNLRASKA